MRNWLKFTLCSILSMVSLEALPTVVPDPIPCIQDLEKYFFDESLVKEALSLYNVRQELWVPIYHSLQKNSHEIPDRMKRKTAFLVPNPLEYPVDRAVTARLLKEVLLEAFVDAMRENHSNERPRVDFVFDYIFKRATSQICQVFWGRSVGIKTKI